MRMRACMRTRVCECSCARACVRVCTCARAAFAHLCVRYNSCSWRVSDEGVNPREKKRKGERQKDTRVCVYVRQERTAERDSKRGRKKDRRDRRDDVHIRLAVTEVGDVDVCVLVDLDRGVELGLDIRDQVLPPVAKIALLPAHAAIVGGKAAVAWGDPHLDEAEGLCWMVVELGVRHAHARCVVCSEGERAGGVSKKCV